MKKQNKTTRGKYEPLQLAYIAGFFDGEGTICIGRIKPRHKKDSKNTYTLTVRVVGTKKDIIQLHYDLFSPHRTIKSYKYRKEFIAYQWTLTSLNALKFLKLIEPYIILKKEQVKLGIEFQEKKNKDNFRGLFIPDSEIEKREEYRLKMRKLNERNKSGFTHSRND